MEGEISTHAVALDVPDVLSRPLLARVQQRDVALAADRDAAGLHSQAHQLVRVLQRRLRGSVPGVMQCCAWRNPCAMQQLLRAYQPSFTA